MNEAIPVVDEVDEKVIPPQSTVIEAFVCHMLDRTKSRRYIDKLCKNSGREVARMIGNLPIITDNKVVRNTLEAIDAERNCVMRFNLKKSGAVFV